MIPKPKTCAAALVLLLFGSNITFAVPVDSQSKKAISADLVIPLQPGEKIWSGVITDGHKMPYAAGARFDFDADNGGNQTQPLLLGSQGLWVWSEEPYAFEVFADRINISNAKGVVKQGRAGNSLAEAREFASAEFFPPSGRAPDELLFAKPQYNTWIELTYRQNQQDILKYARAIIANGFSAGVLMIDGSWQEDYGVWDFHPGRFPNPKQMMDELHKMGFKVMLWMCPFISPDQGELMRQLMKEKCLLMQKANEQTTWKSATDPAVIKWWDGYSALLDFSNPAAVRWFNEQLDRLVKDYGVDGFKLDAGDMEFYPPDALSMQSVSANRQCELYAQFGLRFPLNEYRACWKMAGQPLAQRLRDKNHNWEDAQKLIPHMLAEGLAGYTFSCPDMIGGGEYLSFLDLKKVDQDLIVRSAQVHALMPMMQFSVAPWRVLDEKHLKAVKKAVAIRETFVPLILELARKSAKTGEPIISSMEYVFPHQGFESVIDQFMLGDSILVAPLDKPGTSRQLVLPKGEWLGDDGRILNGGASHTLEVPLDRIPYFRLMKTVKAAWTPQMLIDDTSLAHEAKPEGVPDSTGWSEKPRKNAEARVPDGWGCTTMWGQIYAASGGSKATNVRIEIRELVCFYLSKKTGKWVCLQYDPSLDGAAFREDFANDESIVADLQRQSDGTVSVKLTPGRNFHFWPTKLGPARATIDPPDVAALASAFKARIVTADPTKPDDRAKAKLVGSCGGDLWRALDSKWKDDWSNNGDWALGRFRYLTGEWQVFTACTADAETIRTNTPPLYPEEGQSPP